MAILLGAMVVLGRTATDIAVLLAGFCVVWRLSVVEEQLATAIAALERIATAHGVPAPPVRRSRFLERIGLKK